MLSTYTEVSEAVEALHSQFATVREDAERRYSLYQMHKEPYVAEEIGREGIVRLISPMLIHAAQTIRADLMMNPTELTVIPLAREHGRGISTRLTEKAENLERALAILWGRLNEGRRIDREIIWHQLVSPFGIMMLEFNALTIPDQPDGMSDEDYVDLVDTVKSDWLPWDVYIPDPTTCSWMERGGKPVVFARKYKLLVRDLIDHYNRNASSTNPEAGLFFENGHFRWVSDDYPQNQMPYRTGFEEVEVLWLDDGEYIYQGVMNPGATNDTAGGMLLTKVPNMIGRPTAFIVPGNTTPARKPENRYEPFLLSLMQTVSETNDIRSTRATAARNLAGPHTYVVYDPEIVKIFATRNEKLPTEIKWKKNVTLGLYGKLEALPSELSPDYDKLETAINEETQRYLPSPFVNVVDPAVIKSATATSILHAAESGIRMYGPLMSAFDSAVRDMLESIIYTLRTKYADEDFKMFATGEERAHNKRLREGTLNRLNTDSVDFSYKLIVKTRSMSRAQASAQYEAKLAQWILPDGSKGPATLDDLIEGADYGDPVQQMMKLAKEGILNTIDPWIQEMAIAKSREEIMIDSGLDLPLVSPGQLAAGGNEERPSRLPNQAQKMEAPLLNPREGGSSPTGSY